jgi:hypothetical protein
MIVCGFALGETVLSLWIIVWTVCRSRFVTFSALTVRKTMFFLWTKTGHFMESLQHHVIVHQLEFPFYDSMTHVLTVCKYVTFLLGVRSDRSNTKLFFFLYHTNSNDTISRIRIFTKGRRSPFYGRRCHIQTYVNKDIRTCAHKKPSGITGQKRLVGLRLRCTWPRTWLPLRFSRSGIHCLLWSQSIIGWFVFIRIKKGESRR